MTTHDLAMQPDKKPIGYLMLLNRQSFEEFFSKSEQKEFGVNARITFEHNGQKLTCYPHKNLQPIDMRFTTEELAREATTNITVFGMTHASIQTIPKYLPPKIDSHAELNPEWENAPWIAIAAFIQQPAAPRKLEQLAEDTFRWVNKQHLPTPQ